MRRIRIRMFIVVGFNLRNDYLEFALSLEVIAVCQLIGYFLWYGCLFNLKGDNVFESSSFSFSFLARIRFPKNESISSIVRKRYSGEVLKVIRKFEKVDYKLGKAKLDISFLVKCHNENIIPNFLKFRLANKILQNSVTYKKCRRSLLQTEIDNKKSHFRTLQNEFNRLRNELHFELNCIDFAHISAIFLSSNDNLLKTHDSIQQEKFSKLSIENRPKQDPEKVIFNFSKWSLTNAEKTLLVKGLSFALPPKQLSYSYYLINFELFY